MALLESTNPDVPATFGMIGHRNLWGQRYFGRERSEVINGNVEDALKVLKARLGNLQKRPQTFDWEFASIDPENPITQ
ncbi:hypothetical protein AVEN_65799-1, partial [Araneus ventricosus]